VLQNENKEGGVQSTPLALRNVIELFTDKLKIFKRYLTNYNTLF
jgi:hypothetical protein